MNIVELDGALLDNPRWTKFAARLKKAMMEEYRLDGVTVVLRKLTAEEALGNAGELLGFDHEHQRFEFALAADARLPAAWKIADRMDHFLNPDTEG
jgi:hypothetical protein